MISMSSKKSELSWDGVVAEFGNYGGGGGGGMAEIPP